MKNENLINYNVASALISNFRNEVDIAMRLFIKNEQQEVNCDRVQLYFKAQLIKEEILNKAHAIIYCLEIDEVDKLIKTLYSRISIEGMIFQLNDYYNDLSEENGVEVLIPYFKL